ncbi:MAG TPA: peptidoglycan-associated lipoprotein Pal [Vicinamibacteria bacterium]|nr:peptidoglycan-associated lipoprotein Pal [Vicinamibacteria bacterium]
MRWILRILCLSALSLSLGCGGKSERAPATTSGGASNLPRATTTAPSRPTSVAETDPRGGEISAVSDPDNIYGRTLDEINADSPLRDVPFDFDSAVLLESARPILDRTAEWLQSYSTVTLLVEGHCDERGTVEYNLALGERRATAAYNYLVSLGIPASRLKTISYGKEFPLDPGHTESAWARNRRAHFEVTSK